ncbi:MAG: hemolysin family protein [Planctomycetota bacterium]
MGSWIYWAEVGVVLVLMLSATLNLALRVPSRARFAAHLEMLGRAHVLERFVARRAQFAFATAAIRAGMKVVLIALLMAHFGALDQGVGWQNLILAGVLGWLLILVFAIAIPTAWAKYCGPWLVARFMPLLIFSDLVCRPFTFVLTGFDPVVRRLAGVPVQDAKAFADEIEQQILDVISEGERHGAVDEEEKEMIESVIEFSDTQVEEIMTTRTEMIALPKLSTLDEVLEVIRTKGHSRIPVYDETIDKILGVLYAKDLLRRDADQPFDLTENMREALFIPESKPVRDLLREFQETKVQIAIVLDEYGGTAGLVTIEDIVEELVGDISDEYEEDPATEFERIDEQTIEVDARMRIDELNDELSIEMPEDEDYETIGGFVFATMGKIPSPGETCEYQNIGITVVAAEARRITRLRLKITPSENTNSADNGRAVS